MTPEKDLEAHGVRIEYGMDVKNVIIKNVGDKKIAEKIVYLKDGKEEEIGLTEDDLVFITNGCCTDTSCYGDQTHKPDLSGVKNGAGESWDLWKNIAKQAVNGEYGDPDNWYLSWTINRQPQFKAQNKDSVLIWVYSLSTDKEGNYVKKAMRDCTGEEVCKEWLYHIGIPTSEIDDLAKNACNTTTCFMPFINAFFQPRKKSDRPLVVPEVWGSQYDVRELLRACYYAIDKKPISEAKLSFKEKEMLKVVLKKVKDTDIELLLKDSGLIE